MATEDFSLPSQVITYIPRAAQKSKHHKHLQSEDQAKTTSKRAKKNNKKTEKSATPITQTNSGTGELATPKN
jgi:hypothetical protein